VVFPEFEATLSMIQGRWGWRLAGRHFLPRARDAS
jgi:hypothetical protein